MTYDDRKARVHLRRCERLLRHAETGASRLDRALTRGETALRSRGEQADPPLKP